MPLTLVLVRHGRTSYNEQGLLQGWCDSPLTPDGLAEVHITAAHLTHTTFDAAYISPSGRTLSTAGSILAGRDFGTAVTVDARLREFHFGDFEATPEGELFAQVDPYTLFPEVIGGSFAGLPGGETGHDFIKRVNSVFTDIESRHPDQTVLVVSHGVTLMAYLATVPGTPLGGLPNASISIVTVQEGKRELTQFGVVPGASPSV